MWYGNVQDIREEISTSAPPYSSTKNPYFEKIKFFCGTRCFVNEETENHKTRWRECFKNYPPELHVEIGCNGGHYLLEKAKLNPKCAFIGIDWKLKQIYKAAEKANKQNLTNTLFLKANAERIANIFGQYEIDHLYYFFPDPWPKQSQQKKRFFTKERLTQISNLIKPGGVFEIKTDHEDYYAWILKELQKI
ncbi:MAG: tRNA (guanosine(46)-N7)-methyltransferase TrmB, partial [Deltaproteobacteria bacterium]|nr:tRNA (guanosine(46)-N7)-methyltransferase TrmB [Deltaproteobacteria bacterium]